MNVPIPLRIAFLAVHGLTAATAVAQAPELPTARHGAPFAITRALGGGDEHTYEIVARAGELIDIAADQRRIDLGLRLLGPTGKMLFDRDAPDHLVGGFETILAAPANDATYRVVVRAVSPGAVSASYTLRIEVRQEAVERREVLLDGDRSMAEGLRQEQQDGSASTERALDAYRRAAAAWSAAGSMEREARARLRIADMCIQLDRHAEAEAELGRARDAGRRIGEPLIEAHAAIKLGVLRANTGQPFESMSLFEESAALARRGESRHGEATSLNNLGFLMNNTGRLEEAVGHFRAAQVAFREVGDLSGVSSALNNLANNFSTRGRYQDALDAFKEALAVSREGDDRVQVARSLNNLGAAYGAMGRDDLSFDHHAQAVELFRALGDLRGEISATSNLAGARVKQGDLDRATAEYEHAISLCVRTGDSTCASPLLHNLGKLHSDQRKNPAKALEYFERALATERLIEDREHEAVTLGAMALAYHRLERHAQAKATLLDARQISQSIGDRPSEATHLFYLGQNARATGHLDQALAYFVESQEIRESLRRSVDSPSLRMTYAAGIQQSFEFSTDVLMQLHRRDPSRGHDRAALQIAERSRARSLLDALVAVRPPLASPAAEPLGSREKALHREIERAARAHGRAVAGAAAAETAIARRTLDGLLTDLEDLRTEIRRVHPAYARLAEPTDVAVEALQRDLLDDDTVLVEYALGDERSFAWVLSRDRLQAFELAGRSTIEPLVQRLQDLVTSRNARPARETARERRLRIDQADAEFSKAAGALSAEILGPFAAQIGQGRILIAASGALQAVPFAALPWSLARPSNAPEIVMLPSASVAAALVRRAPAPAGDRPTVRILADPVFDVTDRRTRRPSVRGRPPTGGEPDGDLRRAAEEAGLLMTGPALPRLRYTRDEAAAIAALVPPEQRQTLLDFDANVQALAGRRTAPRILHLATHAFINSEHPELSGIVLSTVGPSGEPIDGFLRLHQLLSLDIPADLVVLSACETALGKRVSGEGYVGLTSGFIQAGARSVVSSLWQVDDQATAQLMRRFYQGLLGPRRLAASAALKAAQAEMARHVRFNHPYYWSGFVIQGDWRVRFD